VRWNLLVSRRQIFGLTNRKTDQAGVKWVSLQTKQSPKLSETGECKSDRYMKRKLLLLPGRSDIKPLRPKELGAKQNNSDVCLRCQKSADAIVLYRKISVGQNVKRNEHYILRGGKPNGIPIFPRGGKTCLIPLLQEGVGGVV
jgi:hypothetical protein